MRCRLGRIRCRPFSANRQLTLRDLLRSWLASAYQVLISLGYRLASKQIFSSTYVISTGHSGATMRLNSSCAPAVYGLWLEVRNHYTQQLFKAC